MSTSASAARASEPSMEEILSSIRKIIADDQKSLDAKAAPAALPASAQVAPAPPAQGDDEDDVLDLELATEAPVAAPPPPPAPRAAVAPPPPILQEARPAQQFQQPPVVDQRLISDQAAAATSSAFHALANTVFSQNARTLDDLVGEMLRPMLKSWLDQNLPGLVERLVRAEIERVARGGR